MDTMIFNLTRDSVSMGDDVNAPHTEILTFSNYEISEQSICEICLNYLPNVAGVGHFWEFYINNILVAIIKVEKIHIITTKVLLNDSNNMFFKYNSSII
jgi:hypothetical protein